MLPTPARLALAALCLALAQATACRAAPQDPPTLHRYWPRFPRPELISTVRQVSTSGEAYVLQSLCGLAARASLHGPNRHLVWYPIGHPAYERWRREMLAQTRARWREVDDVWLLVEEFRRMGIVKGYVLFRDDMFARALHERAEYDPSANVGTVLCARLGGVLVPEWLEDRVRATGLPLLADARSMTEEECFTRWGPGCSTRVLALIEPKVPHCRAEAIALDAFVLATHGPLLERALARLEPDSPILGWGLGAEDHLTVPISRYAAWNSATNWCLNLPLLSTEAAGATIPAKSLRVARPPSVWDLRWEEGKHHAAFLMSDGDNVQWLMGDFLFSAERSWWNSPARGRFPMGWGGCLADLAQLCPYALRHVARTATPRDDMVLLGGGYYYPDLFGEARGGLAALRTHARRMRAYLRLTGARVLHMNAMRWDSPAAVRAYTVFAEEIPELLGILMVQYAPYSAGQGRVLWVKGRNGREVPVVSARFALWGKSPFPDDGPPAEIARRLSEQPACGARATEAGFSWVTVHCWSWFREAPDGAPEDAEEVDQSRGAGSGGKRGLEPVGWCIRRLAPHVRVMTPTELLMTLNLRLRPARTLADALAALEGAVRGLPARSRRAARAQIAESRRRLARGEWRAAFQAGQRAARLARR